MEVDSVLIKFINFCSLILNINILVYLDSGDSVEQVFEYELVLFGGKLKSRSAEL